MKKLRNYYDNQSDFAQGCIQLFLYVLIVSIPGLLLILPDYESGLREAVTSFQYIRASIGAILLFINWILMAWLLVMWLVGEITFSLWEKYLFN